MPLPSESRPQPRTTAPVERVIEAGDPPPFELLVEIWRARELVGLLAWRDLSLRYSQTFFGVAWALLQPVALAVPLVLFLGPAIGRGDSPISYAVQVFIGLIGWTAFATGLSSAAQSVVDAQRLVTKVYFPRLVLPAAALAPAAVDLLVALTGFALGWIVCGNWPPLSWLAVPLAVFSLLLTALAIGTLFAGVNALYRDVRFVLPLTLQAGLLCTPAVYLDLSQHWPQWPGVGGRLLPLVIGANPLNGILTFLRAALTGTPLPWLWLAGATLASLIGLVIAVWVFSRCERQFSDRL